MGWQIYLSSFLLLLLAGGVISAGAATSINTISPNCPENCGNVSIPYPFGIGDGCYLDESFNITCLNNSTPISGMGKAPKAVKANFVVNSISLTRGKAQWNIPITYWCTNKPIHQPVYDLGAASRLSNTDNKFVATGCDNLAAVFKGKFQKMLVGCYAGCSTLADVRTGSCSGGGCCEILNFENDLRVFQLAFYSFGNEKTVYDFNPCKLIFVVDRHWFQFSSANVSADGEGGIVPVVVDWAIRSGNKTCQQAQADSSSYGCKSNHSVCLNSTNGPGYICNCSNGFEGNPYLPNGCQDIDECIQQPGICHGEICTNKIGSYDCSCRPGHLGDAKIGTCVAYQNRLSTQGIIIIVISTSMGFLILLLSCTGCWKMAKTRKIRKRKQSYYKKNVALLHEDQNPSDMALVEKVKIYDLEDLEKATNNFDKTRIIGGGGHGHVFKGLMLDQRVVAIKKPKITSEDELKQFVNEISILSQTNHRNVVKFFGCCLQAEVPLLVFEFISGGTLHDYLVNDENFKSLTYKHRFQIATEIASALSYLHSETSITIFHRDIKSSNILIDERGVAKVADFGASRVVPLDQDSIVTMVQGTYGYLDPEYHQTQRLTSKSDVYSFGVILVELLSGKVATPYKKDDEYRYIVMDFLESIRQKTMYKVLDPQIFKEAEAEGIERLALLADACLRLNGSERPTMKEVENELEAIRSKKSKDHHHESEANEQYIRFYNNVQFDGISS